jgi:DNA gyrase inhibitor GyrI
MIGMQRELEVEVGTPVAAAVDWDRDEDGEVQGGVPPGGRYATARYAGHLDGLIGATAFLLEWVRKHGIGEVVFCHGI